MVYDLCNVCSSWAFFLQLDSHKDCRNQRSWGVKFHMKKIVWLDGKSAENAWWAVC